jgi:hypothetical protein
MSWAGELRQPAKGSYVSEHSTVDVANGTQPGSATGTESVAESPAPGDFKVFLSLTGGERVEAGEFDTEQAAHGQAEEIMAAAAQATTTAKWPYIAGRYLRPETIVSVDVERADQPRWTGSTGRASSWNSR